MTTRRALGALVLTLIAAGAIAGIFVGSGPVGGQIGAGVIGALFALMAWRTWTGPHAQSPRE